MIHQSERDALRQQIKKGDYLSAAQIYKEKYIRQIGRRYLQAFIEGHNNPTGAHPGSHNPLHMYEAVAEAVRQRIQRENAATEQARAMRYKLIEKIQRDTKPASPVPL